MISLSDFTKVDYGALLTQLRGVLVDPASNLTAFILVLAIIAIAGLMVISVLMLFLLGPGGRRRPGKKKLPTKGIRAGAAAEAGPTAAVQAAGPEASEESRTGATPARKPKKSRKRLPKLAQWAMVLACVAGAVYLIGGYSGSQAICLKACHQKSVKIAAEHKSVRCVECHEGRGLDRVIAVPRRLAHVATAGFGMRITSYPSVEGRECAACHTVAEADRAAEKDKFLLMSHREPVGAGLRCGECHRVAHSAKAQLVPGAMQVCVRCHDADAAKADCSVCHRGDPTRIVWARGDKRPYSPVPTKNKYQCGACHEQTKCDACHGLRLPHSQDFLDRGHARMAAFDGKKLCWRCHSRAFCGKCHFSLEAHGANAKWKVEHGRGASFSSPCGCHDGKGVRAPGSAFCPLCHDSRPAGVAP